MKKLTIALAFLLTFSVAITGCGKGETIGDAGTYSGDYDVLTITADGTIVEDSKATKVVIDEKVGDGDVTLRNMNIETLEVYGGGDHSIHVENSTVENVVSNKDDGQVRIVVEKDSAVGTMESENTIIEVKDGAEVEDVKVNTNAEVTVAENAKAKAITLADTTATAKVEGEVAKVTVEAPKAEVVVAETAKVETIKVEKKAADAKVTVNGEVANVAVEAPKTKVVVAETAKVETIKVEKKATDAKVTVDGEVAKIDTAAKVEVGGEGTVKTIETTKETLVKSEATSNVVQNAEVTVKGETTPTTNTTTSNTSSSNNTTTTTRPVHTHSYTVLQSETAATCTTAGNKVFKCSGCSNTTTQTVSALGHKEVTDKAVAATCTKTGLTEGKHCSVCNTVTVKQNVVNKLAHKEDAGSITTPATCTAEGVKTFKCEVCSTITKTEAVAAKGHTTNAGVCSECSQTIATVSTQDELNNAVKDAVGPIEVVLPKGEFDILSAPMTNKDVTFVGTQGTEIDLTALQIGYANNMAGAKITFDGIKVEFSDNNTGYQGLKNAAKVVYKNCIITGTQFLYGDADFINCTLEATKAGYNVWTYGANNVTFTDCTFNAGGRAVLVYFDQNTDDWITDVVFNNCKFNDTDSSYTDAKAAVETGDFYNHKYNLTFNNCNINGFEMNKSTSPLWGNKNSMGQDRLNVVINGADVY